MEGVEHGKSTLGDLRAFGDYALCVWSLKGYFVERIEWTLQPNWIFICFAFFAVQLTLFKLHSYSLRYSTTYPI